MKVRNYVGRTGYRDYQFTITEASPRALRSVKTAANILAYFMLLTLILLSAYRPFSRLKEDFLSSTQNGGEADVAHRTTRLNEPLLDPEPEHRSTQASPSPNIDRMATQDFDTARDAKLTMPDNIPRLSGIAISKDSSVAIFESTSGLVSELRVGDRLLNGVLASISPEVITVKFPLQTVDLRPAPLPEVPSVSRRRLQSGTPSAASYAEPYDPAPVEPMSAMIFRRVRIVSR